MKSKSKDDDILGLYKKKKKIEKDFSQTNASFVPMIYRMD